MARNYLENCSCGSGKFANAEYDGHGIFMCFVCDDCYDERMKGWRSDIKERYFDPLDAGESLEPEDY